MQESQILDSPGVRTQTGHTAFQKKKKKTKTFKYGRSPAFIMN